MIEEKVRTHESLLADGADGGTVLFVNCLIVLAGHRVDECG